MNGFCGYLEPNKWSILDEKNIYQNYHIMAMKRLYYAL
jgi:hypothetical protein